MPVSTQRKTRSMWGHDPESVLAHFRESERRATFARSAPSVLRASGVRIEPMSAERLRLIAGHKQQWQGLAWAYRDMIGELRFALKFRAQAISRVQLYVAQVNPDATDDEPLPVSLRHDEDKEKADKITLSDDIIAAAEEELARLPLGDGYSFLGVWSENFDVAGECWLHGYTDRDTGQETWKIRSVDDVDLQGSTLSIKDELGQPRKINLNEEELYRLWVPHPRRGHLADSALNALMDVLEDITLIGRELRAAARSRIASNGVWLIPDGMVRVKNTKDEEDNPEDRSARFVADLTAAMLAPIQNEGEPGAVVPVVLTGSREDIKAAKDGFLRFEREDSPTLLDKLAKALGRMATALDIPPEILTGMAEVNHWTAWQIDAATFKQYLEPGIRMMADSLTGAMLRAALRKRGFPAEEIARIRYWYSAGSITENPNRRQDALDARDRNAISNQAFREALGFNDQDAPSEREILEMIAGKVGFDQQAALQVLRWAAEQAGEDPPPLPESAPAPQLAPAPRAEPDPTGVGGQGAPDTAPPAVAASGLVDTQALAREVRRQQAARTDQLLADLTAFADQGQPERPAFRLDTDTGRALMAVDRALREKLLDAADSAMQRARERAGSRVRAKATSDPSVRASLAQYGVAEWPARLGREQCLALGADSGFLLAQAWEELSDKFARWVRAAIGRIIPGVLKLSGRKPADDGYDAAARRLTEDMSGRIAPAWDHLQARLAELADSQLFETDPEGFLYGDEGEVPELSVPPYLVRAALAEVGGLPEESGGLDQYGRPLTGEPANGLHNGSTVSGFLEDAGVLTVGYLWVYGITPTKRAFEPHEALEGERFTSWRDPKLTPEAKYAWCGPFHRPGDHRGCMCDFVPAYAIPDYAQQVRDRLATPSQATQDILTLAEQDDAAGRRGTTAQSIRDQHAAIQRLQARFLEGN